jgi:ParB-like chromosome segregation protein Spo0J
MDQRHGTSDDVHNPIRRIRGRSSEVHCVPVSSLEAADSPRLDGENTQHTEMLARIDRKLPPILVHRATMRVIDGTHRLSAARLRGDDTIEVEFFEGSEQEAFVLSVAANVEHGLPLSLADRTVAAERIIATYPAWSDRAIAAATGLGARTVRGVRRRVEAGSHDERAAKSRLGRDGRVRPLDGAEGRRRASQLLRDNPGSSLREVAKDAGVSPSTVLDVRNRLRRGEDPVPAVGGEREQGAPLPEPQDTALESRANLNSVLGGLASDPSLRFTDSGRSLLRWMLSRVVHPGEWRDMVGKVPPHCTYIMADVARRCADEWLQLAGDLEKRSS